MRLVDGDLGSNTGSRKPLFLNAAGILALLEVF